MKDLNQEVPYDKTELQKMFVDDVVINIENENLVRDYILINLLRDNVKVIVWSDKKINNKKFFTNIIKSYKKLPYFLKDDIDKENSREFALSNGTVIENTTIMKNAAFGDILIVKNSSNIPEKSLNELKECLYPIYLTKTHGKIIFN